MGRSTTPQYVLQIESHGSMTSPMVWRVRRQHHIPANGRPTTENIGKWVDTFEESTKPGGCNSHLGFSPVLSAKIMDQLDGHRVVAVWNRPTFMLTFRSDFRECRKEGDFFVHILNVDFRIPKDDPRILEVKEVE